MQKMVQNNKKFCALCLVSQAPSLLVKCLVIQESLLSLYYAYIHTYINYANLAWASTIRTNLKKIHSQRKHAIRIIFRKDKFSRPTELFVQNKVFNLYQLNILNNLIFMHKVRNETAPAVFLPKFQNPAYPYLIFRN